MLYCYSYANKAHCCCCCSCLRKVKWRQTLNIVPLKERTWTRLSCDVDSETHVKINSLLGSLVTVLRSRLLKWRKVTPSSDKAVNPMIGSIISSQDTKLKLRKRRQINNESLRQEICLFNGICLVTNSCDHISTNGKAPLHSHINIQQHTIALFALTKG